MGKKFTNYENEYGMGYGEEICQISLHLQNTESYKEQSKNIARWLHVDCIDPGK